MAEPIESRADLVRQRLIRSVFQHSSLEEVAAAVAVAVAEQAGDIYVERLRGRFSWSLCHRGGSYPLLRITARFLKVDYRHAFIGFCTVPGGYCILCRDPAARIEPDAWTVLPLAELTRSRNLIASIRAALDNSPNLWPAPMALPSVQAQADRVFGLAQAERLTVMEAILAAFLREAGDRAWVLFENAAAADEYVQIMHHDGSLYGEASSREWQRPLRPLTQEAVVSLGNLGFSGGATGRNFRRDGLPPDPARLALLVDSLFATAYGSGSPQGVQVHGKGWDVTAALASLPDRR